MSAPNAASPGSHSESATILVVDDERGPRESLRMILAADHRVLVASSGSEALDLLRTMPVSLATVDLNMPGMRGDELMRTIRERHPEVEVIIITGFATVDSAVEGIRYGVSDYLSKPFDVAQVSAAVERALARRQSRRRRVRFREGVGELLGSDTDVDHMLGQLCDSHDLRRRLRSLLQEPALDPETAQSKRTRPAAAEFLEVLAETIESRDAFMRGHARRTAFFSGLLGERVGVPDDDAESLRLAAFLHDLGKIGVPLEVIQQRDTLSSQERTGVELHASLGERLIKPLGLSSRIASAIRHHHERWDGTGYPDRLRGNASPLASRIIGIADAFDAMTCERPYRPALGQEKALAELQKGAGSQFDPVLVEHFIEMVQSEGVEPPAAEDPHPDADGAS